MNDTFTDARTWKDRWTLKKELASGGQGIAMQATDANGAVAFVKALRDGDQGNSIKRARMYREISSLRTISIPEIPKLIESNADHYGDKTFKLFLAMEFVEGDTLGGYVSDGLVSPNLAVHFAVSLCETLEVAHRHGIYHRDVKPSNIIISSRSGRIVPVVADFGMATLADMNDDFNTSPDVEVGNRFLRLPEFSAGSENKDDPRSDVAFCVGLLFYMLTKRQPRLLMNERLERPHQRANSAELLLATGLHKGRLFSLFDRGFQEDFARRFQSMDELKNALHRLIPLIDESPDEPVTMQSVLERIDISSERAKTERLQAMEQAFLSAISVANGIAKESKDLFEVVQQNRNQSASVISGDVCLQQRTNHDVSFNATLSTQVNGSEVLLSVSGPGVARRDFRIPLAGRLSDADTEAIKSMYAQGLHISTDPIARAGITESRNKILAAAKHTVEVMLDIMLASISDFVTDQDSGIMLAAPGGNQIPSVRPSARSVTAQGSVTGRLRTDDYSVLLNFIVQIALATHLDDIAEMQSAQTVQVTLSKNAASARFTASIRRGGRTMEPFAPSREELRKLLDEVIAKAQSGQGSSIF